MFSSGLLIKAKSSLSKLVCIGSSIQVDDLDEDNVVVMYLCCYFMKVNWMESFRTNASLYNSCC